MKINNAAVPVLIFLWFGNLLLIAQQKKPTGKPAPIKLEDPELHFAFYRAHNAVDQKIQASSVAAAAQLSSATAALYGISASDFPKLTAQTRTLMANVTAWSVQEQAYVAQQRAAKKLPDMKTLVNYQRQRQRLVMNAHAGIHKAMTTSSWTGLDAYVKGGFKTSLQQAPGTGK